MQVAFEISSVTKLKGRIPNVFEQDVLHYQGSRRYVATWWSEFSQGLICADGETWQTNEVDEDEGVWWTYTLTLLNNLDVNCLGFDVNLPIHVLLLDLQERDVWRAFIGPACDILTTQVLLGEGELNGTYIVMRCFPYTISRKPSKLKIVITP